MAVPTAPSALTLTVLSTTSIKLAWTDNANNEDYYQVARSLDGTTYAAVKKLNPNVTTWTNAGLTAGTKYYFKVRCHGADGFSSYCTAASATAGTAVALAAPTSLTAVPIQGDKVEINFTNASVGEDFHCIERNSVEVAQVATGTTYYLDTGLTSGTTYTYRVRDLSGAATYGAYSDTTTATPPKPFTYVGYGSGTTAEGIALTALTTQIARGVATVEVVSTYTANDTARFTHEFTADGAISVAEVAIFDAATTGTMLDRKLISPALSVADHQAFLLKFDVIAKDGGCGG